MSSNRKLLISALRSLNRRNSLSIPPPSLEFQPKTQIPCDFPDSSSHSSEETRVSRAFHCVYDRSLGSRTSSRGFCSESTERSVERCWNCSAAAESTPFLSCGACRSVQSVDRSVDYFQIFGLEKTYDIQTENLESKYKDWQKKLHPDLVHSKSEKEKAYAAEQSARVIDAYRTLRKPLLRAMYLMQLEGEPVDEEQTVSDPELLAEIMEVREAVEEAYDSQALKQIQMQVQRKLENWSNSFGTALKKREFESAATSIQRMTYYERVLEEIVKKL
ncbi:hypothetical protein MRB53_024250 [Persea americana]|uniref:Uncharacterized protein n=1 Tax=Persea americana TaxID=3435 RepID=A0ACC2LBN7_PERAE|nr:hypothetical protein MRB53_024250 [Persea americana]|eukprot:TRINITY_DN31328_c0_g1_i1.p1 TRINITY_DN31328_c0_g1~~TRINITY_DN31328_c0_g1_i1.p1  ORF type:complete len:275 (+),score=39.50 TRINITY_DN31328_c0_g1_i1:121-945(+)